MGAVVSMLGTRLFLLLLTQSDQVNIKYYNISNCLRMGEFILTPFHLGKHYHILLETWKLRENVVEYVRGHNGPLI